MAGNYSGRMKMGELRILCFIYNNVSCFILFKLYFVSQILLNISNIQLFSSHKFKDMPSVHNFFSTSSAHKARVISRKILKFSASERGEAEIKGQANNKELIRKLFHFPAKHFATLSHCSQAGEKNNPGRVG